MDILKQYRIPFTGLKLGLHNFRFEAGEEFFKSFEGAEIGKSDVHVDVLFDKKESFFVLDFSIGGTVQVECDRCAEKFDQEIIDEHRVYVKFDDEAKKRQEEDEDIIYISHNDIFVDVSQLIYELVNLSLPLQKICPPKADGSPGCNEKVLKILEGKTEKKNKEPDPRWAALLKLKVKK
ncbi:MAG: DUF177 domain-containing protein [Chitinophagales bacterium]|nr:DUF177 domain-containing protein [Chitinophagales bacterium]